MIKPPKNEAEIPIWRRLVSDELSGVVYLKQYATADLPILKTTDRAVAWDSTVGSMVTWDGTSWS